MSDPHGIDSVTDDSPGSPRIPSARAASDTSGASPDRAGAYLANIASVVTVVIGLAGLGLFKTVASAFVAAALGVVAFMVSPWGRADRARNFYGIALAVCLFGTGVIFHFTGTGTDKGSPQPQPTKPSTTPTVSASSAAPVHITFEQPDNSSVPYCASFSGLGTVPPGMTLWIFEQEAGTSNKIYIDAQAETTANAWSAPSIDIGSPKDAGAHSEIMAVLLPKDLSDWLNSIDMSSGLPSFHLPPGAIPAAQIGIVRNSNSAACK